ncbi:MULTISPECIES: histidinol-phosphate transaminase [Bacillus]|uniref:histidinol-phosphate transaminase n=1 Tax=Bacillus TaxID=1386 RepID=UPI0022440119|nr:MULTISPECIES: histidinol-phosphate transaminase [Bacillus]MDN5386242.1 histidinol-phosphate transaminase [Bacillus sp. LB7]MEC1020428.1 histidinol-phosphate transaminase [Bacillus paralicheniformis]MEC1026415.1 histidinol-phosphate transaminase [Bacillus paralicheniformis]MEC1036646.1 histidinol-phosphate transaminase [Bacillus paralicheniformis]MEC1052906.1 histidinol-phosphate transaminase [Bacillus paralicheniformis]
MKTRLTVKSTLEDLPTSSPFKPAETLMEELNIDQLVRMGANENPIGPSPKVYEAIIKALNDVRYYPDGSNSNLISHIAGYTGFPESHLVVEAGISGLLRVILETFLYLNEKVVFPWPSYAAYHQVIKISGGIPVPVPLLDNMQPDFPAIVKEAEHAKVVLLCNPNNPTGLRFSNDQIRGLMKRLPPTCLLIVDEAYYEYTQQEGADVLLKEGHQLIVLRTFSKAFGLAGLRVGYGMMDPSFISWINRCREPIMVGSLSKAAAIAALNDQNHLQKSIKVVEQGREEIEQACEKIGIKTLKSSANFVLINCGDYSSFFESELLKKGIMVRSTDKLFQLKGGLRVTIGTKDMNEMFTEAIGQLIDKC